MSAAWEQEDVLATLKGVFDVNAKLADIAQDVDAIRRMMEDGDEEEEGGPEDG
jgi:hypothetical protein